MKMLKKRLQPLALTSLLLLSSFFNELALAQIVPGVEIAPPVDRPVRAPVRSPVLQTNQMRIQIQQSPQRPEQMEYTEDDKQFEKDVAALYRRLGVSSLKFDFNNRNTPSGPTSEEISKQAAADEREGRLFIASCEYLRAAQEPLLYGDLTRGKYYVEQAIRLANKMPVADRKRVLNMMVLMCRIAMRTQYNEPGMGTECLIQRVLAERLDAKMPDDATTITLLRMLSTTYDRQQRYVEMEEINKRIVELVKRVSNTPEELQTAMLDLAHVYKLQNEHTKAIQTLTDFLREREQQYGKNSASLLPILSELISTDIELGASKSDVDAAVSQIVEIADDFEPDAVRDLNLNNVIDPKLADAQNSIEQLTRSWQWYTMQPKGLDLLATERLMKALYKLRVSTYGLEQWQSINTLRELCRFLNTHGKAAESKTLAEDALGAMVINQSNSQYATQIATIIRDAQMAIDHVDPNTASTTQVATPIVPGALRSLRHQQLSVEQAQANLDKLQQESTHDLDAILKARADLAYSFSTRNQRREAQAEFRKAVATYAEAPGKGDSTDILWPVAEFFINRTPDFDDEKSISLLLQTGYRRAASGNAPEWLSSATANFSSRYTQNQRPAQASQILEVCLSYIDKVDSVPPKVKEPLLRQIATLQEAQTEYAGALKTSEDLLPVVEKIYGANSAEYSQQLVQVARLCARVNKPDEAMKFMDKAIAIETNTPHRTISYNYTGICNSIASLANDYINADKLESADKLLRQAFKLVERQGSNDENWVRSSASSLFWKYQSKQEYQKEEALLEWIIESRLKDIGDKDVKSNYYRIQLASAYLTHSFDLKEKDPDQSKVLYDKSTKIFGDAIASYQRIMGPKASELIQAVSARAQSLDGIGKNAEAAALRRDFHIETAATGAPGIPSFPHQRHFHSF